MKIFESPADLRNALAEFRGKDRIAFVPTLGCLHEGHLSLIRTAKKLADIVVVSIYVNPLQFGPKEDFAAYPRTFAEDAALCEAEDVNFIFNPANLYPEGGPKVNLTVKELSDKLCGASRPGHFDGVATVVNILFNIVQPDIAVFGEKDFQQLAIIRRMASDLHMPVEIVCAPTHRESSGLAMSSRNRYLSGAERKQAANLFAALLEMRDAAATGTANAKELVGLGHRRLAEAGIETEYLEIRREADLETCTTLNDEPTRAFIAARVGKARLIDNLLLNGSEIGIFRPDATLGMP